MTFAWPHLLWLLLVPLALLVWELTRARRAAASNHPKILRAEASPKSLRLAAFNALPSTSRARSHPWLWAGLALAIVALARPQWGRLEEPVFDQSREILIAIDLSRSMLSEDVKPSRLERAKLLTQSLLEKLNGERVGLAVFSGTAFLQSPLSSDYEIMREFLPALNPSFLPEGGTNYTALIDTALGAFGTTAAADRFLIILSDGEATDDDWRGRVDDLKKKGIRVIGLGVGTTAGSMIPDGAGGLVKDNRGAVVLSKLEAGTLRELAEATGGVYQDASNWVDLASVINATVNAGRKGQFLEKNTVRLVERFQWPLGLALWCLLVSLYYEFPVRPKPRALKLQATVEAAGSAAARTTATVALLLFVLSPGFVRAARAVDNTGPELGRIYSRLANQDKLYATDLSEVAHATLTWGQRLKENGQPVIPGPVHDAIQAVDQLIAQHSTLADWAKLRADLEALLEKPEDKKQQQKNQPQQKQDKDQQQKNQQDQQNQQQQNSSKQDQSQKQKQPNGSPQNQQQNQPQQSQRQDQQNGEQQQQNQQNASPESAFGNMKEQKPPLKPTQPQQMQKVGGVPEKKEGQQPPPDANLVMPLQKLDQLRNQDSPAELFQLMDADKKGAAKKPDKDW